MHILSAQVPVLDSTISGNKIAIQTLVVTFAAFAVTRVVQRFRRRAISPTEFFVWLGFWITVSVTVLVPDLTNRFAHMLGVGRGADAVFYIGLVTLFYLIFRQHLKIRSLEQQL